jgi:hypothetical protein
MTAVGNIVEDAFRELTTLNEFQNPTPTQAQQALERLQSLISAVYGYDIGEKLEDWPVGREGQHTRSGWSEVQWKWPIANSRLVLAHTTIQTLYLPPAPENGARLQVVDLRGALANYPVTLDGNGRFIGGQPLLLLDTPGLNAKWMYDDDTANWTQIEGLAFDGEMPFPPEFDDYFIIKLAARLAPRYGRSMNDLSLARLADAQQQLEARYRQTRNMAAPLAVRRLPDAISSRYDGGRSGRWGWM